MRIIGQEKIMDLFDDVIGRKALARSYCFVGPDQVGKRTAARQIAAKILGTAEEKLDLHPDFCFIARLEDEKTGKLKKDISVEQARQIKTKVGQKSWLGENQVIILDEAELLNEGSGNALLKILEESKGHTVFFLLTTDDRALLPTVRSRCQMFYFHLVSQEEIEKSLADRGIEKGTAAESARFSWGRPGRAIALCENETLRRDYIREMERWDAIIGQPFHKKLEAVADLFGEKTDTIRARDKIISALEIWMVLWRDVLAAMFGAAPMSAHRAEERVVKNNRLSAAAVAGLLDTLNETKSLLLRNINSKLLLEKILLKYF